MPDDLEGDPPQRSADDVAAEPMAPGPEQGHDRVLGRHWFIYPAFFDSSFVNTYFGVVERLFSPELIIVGGGVSKKSEKFFKYLRARAKVVPARLHNDAGIVGAALAWEQKEG